MTPSARRVFIQGDQVFKGAKGPTLQRVAPLNSVAMAIRAAKAATRATLIIHTG